MFEFLWRLSQWKLLMSNEWSFIMIIINKSHRIGWVTTERGNRSFKKPCSTFHRKYENTVKKIFTLMMIMVANVQEVSRYFTFYWVFVTSSVFMLRPAGEQQRNVTAWKSVSSKNEVWYSELVDSRGGMWMKITLMLSVKKWWVAFNEFLAVGGEAVGLRTECPTWRHLFNSFMTSKVKGSGKLVGESRCPISEWSRVQTSRYLVACFHMQPTSNI